MTDPASERAAEMMKLLFNTEITLERFEDLLAHAFRLTDAQASERMRRHLREKRAA